MSKIEKSKIEKCLSWSPFSTSTAVPTRIVWYCKAECQRLDWAYHKAKSKTKEKRAEEKAAGMDGHLEIVDVLIL